MVLRWRGAKNIGIYGVFLFRECEKSRKHRLFGAFWGFAKTVDLTILRGLQKVPTTKITTTTITGPSSNNYNNNNNNDDDDADDDEEDDNNDNDDNDDNDDNKDNDNDNKNKNKNQNEKEDQKQQQRRQQRQRRRRQWRWRQRRCSSQHVMSANSDEIPLSLFLPRPPTGIAGVRCSTIILFYKILSESGPIPPYYKILWKFWGEIKNQWTIIINICLYNYFIMKNGLEWNIGRNIIILY